ncbi:unnamed protein product [Plutella xylostella]|uniref:(diamondback moth) hypothetical protein n=1 Tax=Plutella xylostella TaxID=51655 RepID=A0A8S4FT69_PLUXY|nr:unnamed protein product [Plutella xylostella]
MCVKWHALLGRVANASTAAEQAELRRISSKTPVAATLLPVRSVGVQGNSGYNSGIGRVTALGVLVCKVSTVFRM